MVVWLLTRGPDCQLRGDHHTTTSPALIWTGLWSAFVHAQWDTTPSTGCCWSNRERFWTGNANVDRLSCASGCVFTVLTRHCVSTSSSMTHSVIRKTFVYICPQNRELEQKLLLWVLWRSAPVIVWQFRVKKPFLFPRNCHCVILAARLQTVHCISCTVISSIYMYVLVHTSVVAHIRSVICACSYLCGIKFVITRTTVNFAYIVTLLYVCMFLYQQELLYI